MKKIINMEMPNAMELYKSNKLQIDVNKTVAMLFHTRQKCVNIDEYFIVIDGNIISHNTNTKFLGINIGNNITWKAHINYINKKISNGVGVLLHLSRDLSYNIYDTMTLL